MNCKKRYIPCFIGELLCFIAELVLFVFALLSGSVIAIALAAVASGVCAAIVAWSVLKLLGVSTAGSKPQAVKNSIEKDEVVDEK